MVLGLVLGTFQFIHISKRDRERVTQSRRKNKRVICHKPSANVSKTKGSN